MVVMCSARTRRFSSVLSAARVVLRPLRTRAKIIALFISFPSFSTYRSLTLLGKVVYSIEQGKTLKKIFYLYDPVLAEVLPQDPVEPAGLGKPHIHHIDFFVNHHHHS